MHNRSFAIPILIVLGISSLSYAESKDESSHSNSKQSDARYQEKYPEERFPIPDYDSYVKMNPPSDLIVKGKAGIILQTLRKDFRNRRIEWWESGNLSPYMMEALVASEDKMFWEHEGVDGGAFFKAAWDMVRGKNYRGASTISMQVAGLMLSDLQDKGERRSVFQKFRQVQAAMRLEELWTKEQILSAYINMVPMRGEIVGIPTASYVHFSVSPTQLSRFQSMVLAVLIRSPNADLQKIKERVQTLSSQLEWEFREEDWIKWTKGNWFDTSLSSWSQNKAFHFAKRFYGDKKGIQNSSLDSILQEKVSEVLKKQILLHKQENIRDGGVLVIENTTGEILSYVGGAPGISEGEYIDSIHASRQAGSTLKPFLYTLAFEEKYLTPTSLLQDDPLNLDVAQGVYRPQNYDKNYHGETLASVALGSSLNIPAVRVILLTGVPEFHSRLKQLGFESLREPDFYGYSLALGTADIRLWELTHAYSILSRGGKDFSGNQIFSLESSFITSSILSNREARSLGFGLENHLSTRFFTAVKTGTSQDMRDNWCVGYNKRYTVGVWMGNLKGDPMKDVTGITGACPVWREVMEYLYAIDLAAGFTTADFDIIKNPPPGIVFRDGNYYIKGTEPNSFSTNKMQSNHFELESILYPVSGMIFTIDPDIPPTKQRILFRSRKRSSTLDWYLNGKKIGSLSKDYPWSPHVGKFKLEIRDKKGEIWETVRFVVR